MKELDLELMKKGAKKLVNEGNASQAMLDKRLKEKKKLEGKYEEISAKLNDLRMRGNFEGSSTVRGWEEIRNQRFKY